MVGLETGDTVWTSLGRIALPWWGSEGDEYRCLDLSQAELEGTAAVDEELDWWRGLEPVKAIADQLANQSVGQLRVPPPKLDAFQDHFLIETHIL